MAAGSMRARVAAHGWTVVAMAAAAALSLYLLNPPVSIFAALLAVLAVFVAAVDLEYLVIPDIANVALFLVGVVLTIMEAPGNTPMALADMMARCIVAGGALLLLRFVYTRRAGVEGLGLGDVKLAAAGAAALAWPTLPIALLIASGGGLLAIASRGITHRQWPDRRAEIPFGAFLAPAIWIAFLLERTGVF
jgi:leader peptidase (prepilin peptidase)/N-methyltransferase